MPAGDYGLKQYVRRSMTRCPEPCTAMMRERTAPQMKMGLLWSDEWFFKYEGPFTRLAKLAIVNVLTSQRINKLLFGRGNSLSSFGAIHARSLVDPRWMSQTLRSDPNRKPHFSVAALHASSLHAYCGYLCFEIASDAQFRYCPTCLAQGFQSSIYQIDGILTCPIHGDAFSDRCPSCGGASPRYAVAAAAFDKPMRCSGCGACYANAWSLDGMVTSWTRVKGSDRLMVVQDWLQRVASRRWPRSGEYALAAMSAREQRLTIFDFLRRAVPLDLPGLHPNGMTVSVGELTHGPFRRRFLDELCAERTTIYRSIRRHFHRTLGIGRLIRRADATRDLSWAFQGVCYSRRGLTPPVLHGFLLWRTRFEGQLPIACYSPRKRFEFERKQMTWPGENRVVDQSTWANFALHCLRRDLAQTREWAERFEDFDTFSNDLAHSRCYELLSEFGEGLYPWRGHLPRGVGLLEHATRVELFCVQQGVELPRSQAAKDLRRPVGGVAENSKEGSELAAPG